MWLVFILSLEQPARSSWWCPAFPCQALLTPPPYHPCNLLMSPLYCQLNTQQFKFSKIMAHPTPVRCLKRNTTNTWLDYFTWTTSSLPLLWVQPLASACSCSSSSTAEKCLCQICSLLADMLHFSQDEINFIDVTHIPLPGPSKIVVLGCLCSHARRVPVCYDYLYLSGKYWMF